LQAQKTLYHVVFKVNGVVISEAYYELGQTIVYPENPESIQRGDYLDVFVGWSLQNTIAAGEETELCFEAVYNSTFQGEDPYASRHNNNKLFNVVLPIVGAVAVLFIAWRVFVRIRKKKLLKASNMSVESDEKLKQTQEATQADFAEENTSDNENTSENEALVESESVPTVSDNSTDQNQV
jgi:hypothetical protein